MTTDRELLELAAKAAWITDKLVWWENRFIWDSGNAYAIKEWNPLTDDGDALRLAVKLDISISFRECIQVGTDLAIPCICHEAGLYELGVEAWHVCKADAKLIEISEVYGLAHCAATRRAIVRAAAEIGRTM